MKKSIIIIGSLLFIVLAIIITIKHNKWDGQINGKNYYIEKTCVKNHFERRMRLQLIGKTLMPMNYSINVCDKYEIDTIWESKEIEKL
jgi:hypothetical protein